MVSEWLKEKVDEEEKKRALKKLGIEEKEVHKPKSKTDKLSS